MTTNMSDELVMTTMFKDHFRLLFFSTEASSGAQAHNAGLLSGSPF